MTNSEGFSTALTAELILAQPQVLNPSYALPFAHLQAGVAGGLYWKVIMSVRLSVGAFGFKGSFLRLPLP